MEARVRHEEETQRLKAALERAGAQIYSFEVQVSEFDATIKDERAIAATTNAQDRTEIERLCVELDSAADEISGLHATMRDERSDVTVASTKMQIQHNDDMQRLSAELESACAQVSTMEIQGTNNNTNKVSRDGWAGHSHAVSKAQPQTYDASRAACGGENTWMVVRN
jgi:predicted RNase H-like nuclease (RuvC/YqgF family)